MNDRTIQASHTDPTPPLEPKLIALPTKSFQPVVRFTLIFGLLHAMLWGVCFGLLVFYVPPAVRLFRDYSLALPATTKLVIELSMIVGSYFMLLPMLLGFWLLFEVPLMGILRSKSRVKGWTWALLNLLLPLLCGAFIIFAIELPKMNLLDGLSR